MLSLLENGQLGSPVKMTWPILLKDKFLVIFAVDPAVLKLGANGMFFLLVENIAEVWDDVFQHFDLKIGPSFILEHFWKIAFEFVWWIAC